MRNKLNTKRETDYYMIELMAEDYAEDKNRFFQEASKIILQTDSNIEVALVALQADSPEEAALKLIQNEEQRKRLLALLQGEDEGMSG